MEGTVYEQEDHCESTALLEVLHGHREVWAGNRTVV